MSEVQTSFQELAALCENLASTSSRNDKISLLSSFLKRVDSEEVAPAVLLLIGRIFPESDEMALEIGGTTLWKILKQRRQSTLVSSPLTILKVRDFFDEVARAKGPGSRLKKRSLLESMLSLAGETEAKWIVKSIFGEMQHGVNEGIMLEAIADSSGVDLELIRRADMFLGDLGELARIARTGGKEAVTRIGLTLFRPVKPMLAEMSYDIEEVLKEHAGTTSLEFKFDGARIQVHSNRNSTRIFSRQLSDVTESLPDIVSLVQSSISADEYVAEGEVLPVDKTGKPLPFQDLMRRFRRIRDVQDAAEQIPLKLYLFDLIYLDGASLIDVPYSGRWRRLERICPHDLLAHRLITSSITEAREFLERALREGHEGIVAKQLQSDYSPGKRGRKWLKVKPADFLDLVVVAADWGYGRRSSWLSNYHLAALDADTGEFEVVGKTFKGLTDDEFEEMTRRLRQLKVRETEGTVYVRPEVVVEVAYNEIQSSPHYRSGFALRFARITRIRPDKAPSEADTLDRLRKLFELKFQTKGRAAA